MIKLKGIVNKVKKQSRTLNESTNISNKTIINVDIQPEYKDYIPFISNWVDFINNAASNNDIVFLYNDADTLGMVSKVDYMTWLLDLGIEENILYNAQFYDKGYAFFRYCMDEGIDEDSIVELVKYMMDHDINDSRDMNDDLWLDFIETSEVDNEEIRDLLEYADDMIGIPDLMEYLSRYSNIILTGGGINECLKEVEIALLSLDKDFTILGEYTY